MKRPKKIKEPELENVEKLSASELNEIKLDERRAPIEP